MVPARGWVLAPLILGFAAASVWGDSVEANRKKARELSANLREKVVVYETAWFRIIASESYDKRVREETEGPLLEEIRRRADEVVCPGTGDQIKHVVYFRLKKDLPLVGT